MASRLLGIDAALDAAGFIPRRQLVTARPGDATDMVARDGTSASTVVAVGGDGTVSEVVRGILATGGGARLGILPAGSGNDLQRGLGIPADLPGAVAVLAAGRERAIDVGWLGRDPFVNVAGLGFDGAAAERAAHTRLPGRIGYVAAVLAVVAGYRNAPLHLRAGTLEAQGRALGLTIGNGPWCGGGFRLTPHADLADGLLDFVRLGDFGLWARLRNLLRAMSGNHLSLRGVQYVRADQAWLEIDQETPAHLDGNPCRLAAGRHDVRVQRAALRVIVP